MHLTTAHASSAAVVPTRGREERDRDVVAKAGLESLSGNLNGAHQVDLADGTKTDSGLFLVGQILAGFDAKRVLLEADPSARSMNVEWQGVIARGEDAANGFVGGRLLVEMKGVEFVGLADSDKGDIEAPGGSYGYCQRRGDYPVLVIYLLVEKRSKETEAVVGAIAGEYRARYGFCERYFETCR